LGAAAGFFAATGFLAAGATFLAGAFFGAVDLRDGAERLSVAILLGAAALAARDFAPAFLRLLPIPWSRGFISVLQRRLRTRNKSGTRAPVSAREKRMGIPSAEKLRGAA
jgi:hypothetical protein